MKLVRKSISKQTYVGNRHPKIFIFIKTKIYQKEISTRPTFVYLERIKISMSELCQFSIHQNCIKKYIKTTPIFRPSKLPRKKYMHRNDKIFHASKLCRTRNVEIALIFHPPKSHRNEVDFSPIEIRRKKYVEMTSIFLPCKLRWQKYVKTMSIFRPLKLHQRKYVKTTSVFRPSKLHRKSSSKKCGNSSIFYFRRRIDVDLTCCIRWDWYPACSLSIIYRKIVAKILKLR